MVDMVNLKPFVVSNSAAKNTVPTLFSRGWTQYASGVMALQTE